jgi:hypothetical protein
MNSKIILSPMILSSHPSSALGRPAASHDSVIPLSTYPLSLFFPSPFSCAKRTQSPFEPIKHFPPPTL